MSVEIIKEIETYPKSSRTAIVKSKVVAFADNYREALNIIQELQTKETKSNVVYKTGKITR